MLDILMAIKNNNVSKIPSYSPEHVEHLKKLLRSLVRRGNYVAELKISLADLLEGMAISFAIFLTMIEFCIDSYICDFKFLVINSG